MSSTSGPSSLNSATTRFARRRFAPTTPSASAGALAETIAGARGAGAAQPGHATVSVASAPSFRNDSARSKASDDPRSVSSFRPPVSAVASGPAAFARASVRARGLPPSPPDATSPIETRTSDGTHSAVSSTTATAPASGRGGQAAGDLLELPVAVARLQRRQRRGRGLAGGCRAQHADQPPVARLRGPTVTGVDQRHVRGADARVAIAADGKRRRQLLRDEPVDRGAEQQRLGPLDGIRGRRGRNRRGRQAESQNADRCETDRASRHRTSKPQSAASHHGVAAGRCGRIAIRRSMPATCTPLRTSRSRVPRSCSRSCARTASRPW